MNTEEWDCYDCDVWQYSCTIPWKFTLNLATHFMRHELNDSALTPFWEFMEKWEGTTNPPTLNLTTCETFAFPEQNDEGWRKSGTLTVMKNRIQVL